MEKRAGPAVAEPGAPRTAGWRLLGRGGSRGRSRGGGGGLLVVGLLLLVLLVALLLLLLLVLPLGRARGGGRGRRGRGGRLGLLGEGRGDEGDGGEDGGELGKLHVVFSWDRPRRRPGSLSHRRRPPTAYSAAAPYSLPGPLTCRFDEGSFPGPAQRLVDLGLGEDPMLAQQAQLLPHRGVEQVGAVGVDGELHAALPEGVEDAPQLLQRLDRPGGEVGAGADLQH